jgi:mono/diheme cytochrome c family protein
VTEIPEHLLKRSKERRAAIGGEEAPAAESTPSTEVAETAAEAPAPAAAAAVATPEPVKVPEPLRPEVAAALSRKKIPFWAMPVLAALPLWAYVYQATLEPAPTGELTPLEAGGEVYGKAACASCHGAGGAGLGSAPGFEDVLEVWPDFRDHLMWVRVGNQAWFEAAGEEVYGETAKASANGVMPAHPTLSDEELAQVVLYERVQFGDMEETGEEYELLLAIAAGEKTFADLEGIGPLSEAIGFTEDDLAAG